MRRGLGMVLVLVAVCALVVPHGAAASCTQTITCSNACAEHLECTSGIVISCSSPAQVISCAGTTSCSQTATSVTCDGTVTACKTVASRCAKDAVSIRCDSTFKACPTCGGRICPSSMPSTDFFDSLSAEPAKTTC